MSFTLADAIALNTTLMRQKFVLEQQYDDDRQLCADILHLMAQDKVDHTLFVRRLSRFIYTDTAANVVDLFT